jgi:hypothetical protein
VWPICLF